MFNNSINFPSQIGFEHTDSHVHIAFEKPFNALSSAVLNGGFEEVMHIVNLKVPMDSCNSISPADTLNNYCDQNQWQGKAVGMMTAASMQSLQIRNRHVENTDIMVLVTAGLSNPKRVGEYAECRSLIPSNPRHDTINIILIGTATFTAAAKVEAIMMITEAKTAALQNANVKSPISNQVATGTGTDSVVVATSKNQKNCLEYCGKHTLIGEIIGQLVIEAVTDAIQWDLQNKGGLSINSK